MGSSVGLVEEISVRRWLSTSFWGSDVRQGFIESSVIDGGDRAAEVATCRRSHQGEGEVAM